MNHALSLQPNAVSLAVPLRPNIRLVSIRAHQANCYGYEGSFLNREKEKRKRHMTYKPRQTFNSVHPIVFGTFHNVIDSYVVMNTNALIPARLSQTETLHPHAFHPGGCLCNERMQTFTPPQALEQGISLQEREGLLLKECLWHGSSPFPKHMLLP